MKSVLLAGVALVMTSLAAAAADLPSRVAEPPAPVAPVLASAPVFTWQGFYAGLNAGALYHGSSHVAVVNKTLGTSSLLKTGSDWGFTGGAQAGYNWQQGAFVYGVETDFQYAQTKSRIPWGAFAFFGQSKNNDGYFGTVRPRVGYTFGPALVYATGGFAYGDITNLSSSNVRAGWTVGAGVEYQIAPNWTVKGEYLYMQLDNKRSTFTATNAGSAYVATGRSSNDINVLRTGLNYKF